MPLQFSSRPGSQESVSAGSTLQSPQFPLASHVCCPEEQSPRVSGQGRTDPGEQELQTPISGTQMGVAPVQGASAIHAAPSAAHEAGPVGRHSRWPGWQIAQRPATQMGCVPSQTSTSCQVALASHLSTADPSAEQRIVPASQPHSRPGSQTFPEAMAPPSPDCDAAGNSPPASLESTVDMDGESLAASSPNGRCFPWHATRKTNSAKRAPPQFAKRSVDHAPVSLTCMVRRCSGASILSID